jgi:5-formyltetrahydrofolate cyclo-ligase
MQLQKQELRKVMKHVLKVLTPFEKERQSRIVETYLFLRCHHFKNAKHIGIYISQNEQEIDTNSIIINILSKTSKSIYVPHVDFKYNSTCNQMKFYQIKTLDIFENDMTCENRYKLKQFKHIENQIEVNPSILDLILVPGLAFSIEDENGFSRLGRGKGYYDRYLSKIPNCHSIGLAFNEQLIPNEHVDCKVPFDKNIDQYLNEVVCEKLIRRRNSG